MRFGKIVRVFKDKIPVLVFVSRDAYSGQMSLKYMWVTSEGEAVCKLRALKGTPTFEDYLAVLERDDLAETIEFLISTSYGTELTSSEAQTEDFAYFVEGHPDYEQILVLDCLDGTVCVNVMGSNYVVDSYATERESLEDFKTCSPAEIYHYIECIRSYLGAEEVNGVRANFTSEKFLLH